MNALIIDTTRKSLIVCLLTEGKLFKEVFSADSRRHTSALLPLVDKLLSAHNLDIADIECFSAVVGPGSFTGIRIGIATVNAFKSALGGRLIEVTAFEPIALGREKGIALVDALHGNYYGGEFESGKIVRSGYYSAEMLENSGLERFVQQEDYDYAAELAAIVEGKIAAGDFKEKLTAFYLRKSQAEREADND